ncbi:unnamed protein product [Blepharisma stoltei]|uniref:CHHC U11-48K-type domain-containing protein n=1 Tax=Blepharisma stoltei TaxID=1481888 RepID=A0AAU9IJG3_9CILI|nr:unnamed protein product [Blepharisma stoltei]
MRSSKETLVCPYNKTHVLPINKLEWHLTECKDKINQSSGFAICPYNPLHHMPAQLLEAHKQVCKNKTQEKQEILREAPIVGNKNSSHYSRPTQQKDLPPGFAPVAAKKKKKNKKVKDEPKVLKFEDPNDEFLPTSKWLQPDLELIQCIEGLQFGLPPGFENYLPEVKEPEPTPKEPEPKQKEPEPILKESFSESKLQDEPPEPLASPTESKPQDEPKLSQSEPHIILSSKSQSPVKPLNPKPADEWVTIKAKPKKKAPKKVESSGSLPISQSDFNTLAEFQVSASLTKNKKTLKKKLKEIQQLEEAYNRGEKLDPQQLLKLQSKDKTERELASLK